MEKITNDIANKVVKKIHSTNFPSEIKNEFMFFCLTFPMSEKNTTTFLKMPTKAATIGYLYKHLIRIAIEQNIPRVYIVEYFDIKKKVNHPWYTKERDVNIRKMQDASLRLLKAIQQMDRFVNSRKMKIQKLKEEIELKELRNK